MACARSIPFSHSLLGAKLAFHENSRQSSLSFSRSRRLFQRKYEQAAQAALQTAVVCTAGAKKTLRNPANELTGEDLKQWKLCVEELVDGLGFSSQEEASKLLSRAYGWIFRGYWDDTIVDGIPSLHQLKAVIEYLKSHGLVDEEVKKVVKDFPYILAIDVDKRLKINVEQLDREWGIKGDSLKRTIIRKPILLGYTVDCRGDCIADCDHCWARF